MRKLAVAMALASTVLATPALARDNSWYVGVDGGAMIVEDIKFDIVPVNSAYAIDHHYGYDVDGKIGYDLGHFRLEAEVGYKSATVDAVRSTLVTPGIATNGRPGGTIAGNFPDAGGRTTALSFMVNGLLDFGNDDGVQGFVGGGAGLARIKARYALNSLGNFLNDSDTVFAYQGLAGVRAPLSSHVDVSLSYRYFRASKTALVDIANRTYNGNFKSHSLLGGLTYNFYTPAPPPPPVEPPLPPVAPPPAPVTPPPPVCSPGPFIVFFDWDKSDITPEASSILDNAITQYQNCGNAQVMLAGHADKSGSASYNVGLSARRNDSVKAYLSAHSIPAGVITSEAFGESRPRVETADGVREIQNRRVEVTYGPGSGN